MALALNQLSRIDSDRGAQYFLDRYAKHFSWIEMQNNSSSNLSPSLFGIEIQLSFQYFLCIEFDVALFVFTLAHVRKW